MWLGPGSSNSGLDLSPAGPFITCRDMKPQVPVGAVRIGTHPSGAAGQPEGSHQPHCIMPHFWQELKAPFTSSIEKRETHETLNGLSVELRGIGHVGTCLVPKHPISPKGGCAHKPVTPLFCPPKALSISKLLSLQSHLFCITRVSGNIQHGDLRA